MDITIPNSVYIDGQWATATWLAEIADPATGELIITATINQPTRVAALRLTNDMMRDLRIMAGFTGPTPTQRADRAAAELAYWRESVQFAANMLAETRDAVFSPGPVEQYLRQTLAAAPPSIPSTPSTDCYDCRTIVQRLAAIEQRQEDDAQTFGEHARRLAELARSIHITDRTTNGAFNELDQLLQALVKDCVAIERRLDALEHSKPQPLSAVEALRQIANIQAQDPDGLKMTWSEMALACIRIAEKALEGQARQLRAFTGIADHQAGGA